MEGLVDLDTWFVDSTSVEPPELWQERKGGCEALGRSRSGFSTKLHLVCDGLGNPLTAILTPGQHDDSTVCTELVASVRVQTSAAGGRPRHALARSWWLIEAMMRVASVDTC